MKRRGLAASSPVFDIDGTLVEEASAILDFLDERFPGRPSSADIDVAEANEMEALIARTIGVPFRRMCYEALIPHPELVRFCFMHRSGLLDGVHFDCYKVHCREPVYAG